jgi:hypothetical protein
VLSLSPTPTPTPTPTPALVALHDKFFTTDNLLPCTSWHAFVAMFGGASTVIRMANLAKKTGTIGTAAPARIEVGRNTNSSLIMLIDLAEWGDYNPAVTETKRAEVVIELLLAHRRGTTCAGRPLAPLTFR